MMYKEVKILSRKEISKAWILIVYNDFRKLILWALFFIDENWHIHILTPILLQVVSLIVILIWNKVKKIVNKIFVILNESFVILFWVCSVFAYKCVIDNEDGDKVIGILMELTLIIILSFEIAVFIIQDILDLRL